VLQAIGDVDGAADAIEKAKHVGKLNVHHRDAALERAKELGLL